MLAPKACLIWTAFVTSAAAALIGCSGLSNTPSDAGEGSAPDRVTDDTGAPEDSGVTDQDAGHAHRRVATIPEFHRAAATACAQPRPAGSLDCQFIGYHWDDGGTCPVGQDCTHWDEGGTCSVDQDCTGGTNGRCNCTQIGSSGAFKRADYQCTYDLCASDGDCGGGVCLCREQAGQVFHQFAPVGVGHDPPNSCFAADCQVDSDCGKGGYCSPSPAPNCGWQDVSYHCHKPTDECTNDSDCAPQGNTDCAYDKAVQHWVCSNGSCPDG